jgi:hypothetical protein
MMEFSATIRVDTQDPFLAYNEMRQSLQFTGLDIVIHDTWLKNARKFNEDEACQIAAHWNMVHDQMSIDQRVKFKTEPSRWQKACVAAHEELHRILNEEL